MTWQEFKKVYSWMIKTYPGIGYNVADHMDDVIGVARVQRFKRSGRRWVAVGDEKIGNMTGANYANFVNAVPYFRRLGGRETVRKGYTRIGFIPVFISSISPARDEKTVARFEF